MAWQKLVYEKDAGPAVRAAIGILTLANDIATESEFRAFLPMADIGLFASRIPRARSSTLGNLKSMEGHVAEAMARLLPDDDLTAVAFSCTSGTAVIGAARVASLIREARPGIPVTNPLTAGQNALRGFGARRIALLTPYQAPVNAMIAAEIEEAGFSILARASFLCESGYEMSRVSPRSIREAALALAGRSEVEALFISCTALRVSPVIDDIEQSLGKPVVFSTQAMAWEAARLSGVHDPVAGKGRLLRL